MENFPLLLPADLFFYRGGLRGSEIDLQIYDPHRMAAGQVYRRWKVRLAR
jgi:hypothetical protein